MCHSRGSVRQSEYIRPPPVLNVPEGQGSQSTDACPPTRCACARVCVCVFAAERELFQESQWARRRHGSDDTGRWEHSAPAAHQLRGGRLKGTVSRALFHVRQWRNTRTLTPRNVPAPHSLVHGRPRRGAMSVTLPHLNWSVLAYG